MQKKSTKILLLISVVSLAIIFLVTIINNYNNETSLKYSSENNEKIKPKNNNQDAVSKEINNDNQTKKDSPAIIDYKDKAILKVKKSDFTVGKRNAPVVMIEYASLSCPHCAAFYRESYERIKENYIDSGKVLFVYRNFPLNEPALAAAMYAECLANNNIEKYFSTIKSLFKSQDAWAFDNNFYERIEAIANLEGMTSEKFKKCLDNKPVQHKILEKRMSASKQLEIKSVPSFFINGELSSGYVDYLTLEKLIDKKLQEKNKN